MRLALVCCALAACGPAPPPPDPCATSAAAICARLAECYGGFGITYTYGNPSACEARHAAACKAELAAPASGATAQSFLDCAAAAPALACERLLPGKACRPPAGALPLGASCAFSSQCQSAHCTFADGPCGLCEPPAQVGDSCAVGCEGDVVCDWNSYLCVAPPAVGAACDAVHPCGVHASCVGAVPSAAGACQPNAAKLGAPCDPSHVRAPDCELLRGLVCDAATQRCVTQQFAVDGRACGGSGAASVVCAANGSCLDDGSGSNVCFTPPADGAPCDAADGIGCRWPALCRVTGGGGKTGGAGTCQLPDGALCAPDGVPALSGVVPSTTPPFVPAAHDTSLVVPANSGTVLANPTLVSITFRGNAHTADIDAYGDWITRSPWLTSVGAEYGIGLGGAVAVHLPDAAPATLDDTGIETLLGDLIASNTLPAPDANTLYMLYLEDSVTSVSGGSGTSCYDYLGYHYFVDAGSASYAYAVVVDCPSIGGLSRLENMQQTASHELIEAASDPFIDTYTLDYPLSGLGELADLCDGHFGRDGSFVYQRIWSNAAAAAGDDPCLPRDAAQPFFNVSVDPAQLYAAAAGERIDYTLTGWSSAPVGAWSVSIRDGGGDFTPLVHDPWAMSDRSLGAMSFAPPDAPVYMNGTAGHLTLVVPADQPSGTVGIVYIDSFLGNDLYMTWAMAIVVR